MGKIAQTAEKRFVEGFSCSQAVFSAFAETEGIDLRTALRIASSFGAGMARMGDTCGAVTGGMMALGLKFGRVVADDDEAKEKNYRLVHEFVDSFTGLFESCACRDLLGFEPGAPDASQRFADDPELEKRCVGFVLEASEILEKIIEREGGREVADDFDKELQEIMGQMKCPENFSCYRSGFKELCRARDIGLENYLECLETDPQKCKFAVTFGILLLCKCPLRYYLVKRSKQDK